MKTSKEQALAILSKIESVADARIHPMMGEYLVYVDEKVIGQINHGDLFVKITPFGRAFASDLQSEPPYDGAKPQFVVPVAKIDDQAWLKEFLTGTTAQL